MKKLIIMTITMLFSISMNCVAGIRIHMTVVTSPEGDVTANVMLRNESDSSYYIYGANICTSHLLDKSLFRIFYTKGGVKEILEFSGPIGEGEYGFVEMKPQEERNCSLRLDFNYVFPKTRGIEYSVEYYVENPGYKSLQKSSILKSEIVNFTR